jgi:penicillin-binding protein 1C
MVGRSPETSISRGTTLRPFVYFKAFLTAQYNAGTMVLDIPSQFPGAAEGLIYTPTNPDAKFHGPVNLRDAMGAGLLPPTVSVAQSVGMGNVLSVVHQIGVNGLNEGAYDLSLLERGGAVSVLDIAYSYSVFAAEGQMPGVSVAARTGYRTRDRRILRIGTATEASCGIRPESDRPELRR